MICGPEENIEGHQMNLVRRAYFSYQNGEVDKIGILCIGP